MSRAWRSLGFAGLAALCALACRSLRDGGKESAELQRVARQLKAADLLLFVDGMVDPAGRRLDVGAIAIRDRKILAIATRSGALRYRGAHTQVREFPGAYVYAGFTDAHVELARLGRTLAPGLDLAEQLLRAQYRCLSRGLTRVHDVGIAPRTRATIQRLSRAGRWRLGVYGIGVGREHGATPAPPRSRLRFAGRVVSVGDALGIGDVVSASTNHRREPELGPLLLFLGECAADGLQPVLVADTADEVAAALSAIEQGLTVEERRRLRPRVDGFVVASRDERVRMAGLDVFVGLQPVQAVKRLEAASKAGQQLAFSRLDDLERSGVALCIGSGARAADPIESLFTALGGERPELLGALSPRAAVAACTIVPARAASEGAVRGRLVAGYEADLTILDRDITDVPVDAVPGSLVLATIVAGEVAYVAQWPENTLKWMPSNRK